MISYIYINLYGHKHKYTCFITTLLELVIVVFKVFFFDAGGAILIEMRSFSTVIGISLFTSEVK